MTPVPTAAPTSTGTESRMIGIALGLTGSILINTGNNLQSYGGCGTHGVIEGGVPLT